jgi:hypothetical protein
MTEKIRCAVLAGSEDGKTFLCSGLSRGHWRFDKLTSIVFDPWKGETDWGRQAFVTADFDAFRRAVNGTTGKAVFWDEGSSTGGRDRENADLFTAIRHRHPAFYFVGHRYDAMLPIMRSSLTEILVAACDSADLDPLARVMVDRAVMDAARLNQYEFLHKRKHRPARVLRHTKAEILAGIRL